MINPNLFYVYIVQHAVKPPFLQHMTSSSNSRPEIPGSELDEVVWQSRYRR